MVKRLALLAVLLCVLVAIGSLGGTGQSPAEFSLESDSTVTTPEQTVSNEYTDGELTVRKTAVVDPDTVITGTATVPDPDEQTYFIQFRGSDSPTDTIDSTPTEGAETMYEFDAEPESPGSYAVNIWDPNEQLVKKLLPVVISSHEVTSVQINGSAPEDADVAPSETPPVEVSLTTLEDTSIDSVNLTVWNDDEQKSTTLDSTSDGEYEGTLPSLDEEEYNVQIRVRGGETVDGRPSLIGLSEAHSLTVDDTQGSDGSDTDSGSTDGGSGDSGGSDGAGSGDDSDGTDDLNGTDDANGTDDVNGTDSLNGTDDANGTDDVNGTGDDSTDSSPNETDGSDTDGSDSGDTSENDSDGTIAPNDDNSSNETDDSTPLYAIQAVLLAVVLGGVRSRLKRSR